MKGRIPRTIVTQDQGEVEVVVVPSSTATKIHKCAICEHETDWLEEHILLSPKMFPRNRRYVHTDCLKHALEMKVQLRLHQVGFSA